MLTIDVNGVILGVTENHSVRTVIQEREGLADCIPANEYMGGG